MGRFHVAQKGRDDDNRDERVRDIIINVELPVTPLEVFRSRLGRNNVARVTTVRSLEGTWWLRRYSREIVPSKVGSRYWVATLNQGGQEDVALASSKGE